MQIIIDDSALQQKLEDAADKLADTTQLMQRISMTLLNVTEENFNAEGRPKWAGHQIICLKFFSYSLLVAFSK
jgi:phage gpG-like protein